MTDDLMTVATFGSPVEAEMARNRLAAEGLNAVVGGEGTVGIFGFTTGAMGSVKLLVASADVPRAKEILAHPSARADDYDTGGRPRRSRDDRIQEGRKVVSKRARVTSWEEEADDEEGPLERVEGTVLASRAWRAAIVGLIFLAVSFLFGLWLSAFFFVCLIYSVALLIHVQQAHLEMSDEGRRRFRAAVAINLLVLAAVAVLALTYFLGGLNLFATRKPPDQVR
jgi:hypothetical protein